MILYHFTCVEYLESIKRDGLCRGDVPIEFGKPGLNGVWFTTDPTPQGHGLGGATTRAGSENSPLAREAWPKSDVRTIRGKSAAKLGRP